MKSACAPKYQPWLRTPVKIRAPYLGLSVLRAPVGVTNTARQEEIPRKSEEGIVPIMLMTALYELDSWSLQLSASKLCMVFSAEVDVSHCSWKLKDHSCSNEIKNIDVTIPDFHQGIRLQSSLEIWVQNNFLEASRVAPALRLSPS